MPGDFELLKMSYIKIIKKILNDSGFLIITSCNWTKDQLLDQFSNGEFLLYFSSHSISLSFYIKKNLFYWVFQNVCNLNFDNFQLFYLPYSNLKNEFLSCRWELEYTNCILCREWPVYYTKLHLRMRLLFWRSREHGVIFSLLTPVRWSCRIYRLPSS